MRQWQLIWTPVVVVLIVMAMPAWARDLRVIGTLVAMITSMYLATLVWLKWISMRRRAHPERYDSDRYRG